MTFAPSRGNSEMLHALTTAFGVSDRLSGQRERCRAISQIERWLPVTGLSPRNADGAAASLQQADRRESDTRAQEVDKTGYKQGNTHDVKIIAAHKARRLFSREIGQSVQ